MKRSMIQGHGEEGWGSRGSTALRSTVISSERLGVALEKVMVAACFADLAVMGVLYAGA